MKSTDLSGLTTEELRAEHKRSKSLRSTLIILASLLALVSVYGLIFLDNVGTFVALLAVAASSFSLVPSKSKTKEIESELESRGV